MCLWHDKNVDFSFLFENRNYDTFDRNRTEDSGIKQRSIQIRQYEINPIKKKKTVTSTWILNRLIESHLWSFRCLYFTCSRLSYIYERARSDVKAVYEIFEVSRYSRPFFFTTIAKRLVANIYIYKRCTPGLAQCGSKTDTRLRRNFSRGG